MILKSEDFKVVEMFWEDYQMNGINNTSDIYDEVIELVFEDYVEFCCEQEKMCNILNTATFMVALFTIIRRE